MSEESSSGSSLFSSSDHQSVENDDVQCVGESNTTVDQAHCNNRRHSLRRRNPPDFFAATWSSPRGRGRGRRRGRGRDSSSKMRSNASSYDVDVEVPSEAGTETPTAPVFPMSPLGSDTASAHGGDVEMPSMATMETSRVPPHPMSSVGSSIHTPIEVNEERSDVKIELNHLTKLNSPPNSHLPNDSHINDEAKKVITNIKSALVFHLTSGRIEKVEDMVQFANSAFLYLDPFKVNYNTFYQDVKDFIGHHHDLRAAERQQKMQSFSELKTQYEEALNSAKRHKDEIIHVEGELEMVVKEKEPVKRKIAKLKQRLAYLEQKEEAEKLKKGKCIADHEVARRVVKKLRTEVEAAGIMFVGINQHKNAALSGIASATCRLKSNQS